MRINAFNVTPAEAGVHELIDSGFRRNDVFKFALFAVLFAFPSMARAGGLGSATILPANAVEGSVFTSTVTYVAPSSGTSVGGGVMLQLPSGWQLTNPNASSVVVTSTATATFSVFVTSAPSVVVIVNSGSVGAGALIKIAVQNIFTSCNVSPGASAVWGVQSSINSSDTFALLSTLPFETVVKGSAQRLVYVPWNPINVPVNQPSTIVVQVTDNCQQVTTLPSALNVTLNAVLQDQQTTDPHAKFSTFSDFSSTTSAITMPINTSTAAFYYENSVAGNGLGIKTGYGAPLNPMTQPIFLQANVFSSGFTFNNPSVDNGAAVTGQTTMTLTPDGDGVNDLVYIRFSPSDNTLQWHVSISSDNFNNSVFDRWGNGNPQSGLVWDGHDMRNGNIVPNATYAVKLEVPGLATNTSLSIVVNTAMISGKVTVGGVPVYQAFVNANPTSGSGYSQGSTDANGNYTLYGLRAGTSYNLFASYSSTASQANITGFLSNINAPATNQNFALAIPGIVRVSVVIPAAAASTVNGSVNLYIPDSNSQSYWGNIRLLAGTTTSDNGDSFNPSTWTIIGAASGTYTMHLNLSGYGISDQVVTVAPNNTTSFVLTPIQQASIYGKITLPAAATVNEWVSVQGTPAGSQFPTVYGGASFNVGQSTAIYSIFAVPTGSYTITAQVPNLVPLSTQTFVGITNIGDPVNGGLDFINFSAGNTISGTITVSGDTSGQPNPFTLWINANNPQLGLNAFTQVQLSTSSSSTQTTYSLGGLANGTYQLYPPYMQGFDTNPPGSQNVTVSGSSTNFNLLLTQNTGKITGNIKLPGANSDYTNVHLSLQGPISEEVDLTGPPPYQLKNLNTGFYYLVATYMTSGAQASQNVAVTNGQTQTLDLDLSAQTFSVTGNVNVQSGFSMLNSSGSLVTVNTITDLLAAATTQVLTLGGSPGFVGTTFSCVGGTAAVTTTARVEAFPKNFNNFDQANRNGLTNCFGVGQYKFGTIAADGSFSIPQLYPGIWEIDVYPYFDNGTTPDVAVLKQTVSITNGNAGPVSFALAGGNSVSGTVNLPAGVTDTHNFTLQVLADRGDTIMTQAVSIGSPGTPGSSTAFSIPHLATGTYSLLAQDVGTYDPTTGHNVVTYVAKPLQITLTGGDLTGQTITLATASRIIGKIAIQGSNAQGQPTLTLVTPANSYLLSNNFSINAQANPWVPGGNANADFGSTGGVAIDANNQFTIEGLLVGTYDIRFQQFSYGNSSPGSINLAAYTQGAVAVPPSQTVDLGTITLLPGISLSGTITDTSGNTLSNIRVRAQPSNSQNGNSSIETFTNANGVFNFTGLDPSVKTYDFTAAPRPSPGDTVLPVPYGQVKRLAIDITQSPTLNFSLPPATASLSGKVITADGLPLSYPENDQEGFPAAAVYVFLHGDTTVDNPLGDSNATALDGSFSIPYLQSGVYDITIESLGYKPVKLLNITLSDNTNKDLGTTTLQTGPTLTATLAKPDGSAVNTKDVQTVVAASNDLGSIIFGQVNADANTNNILSIKFAGFDLSPKSYTVLFFDSRNNVIIPPEGKGLLFAANTDNVSKSLTFTPTAPVVLSGAQKSGSNIDVTFYFSRPLRNSLSDQTPSSWLTIQKGLGTISGVILSGDRRQLQFVYTPAPGELNAIIAFSAHTVDIDPSTNVEFVISKTLTLLLGQKATAEQNINPALGGSVSLSDNQDPTHINIPGNAFLSPDGTAADATTSYALTLSATDDPGSVGAGFMKGAERVNQMMAMGEGAYLSESYRAMVSAKASVTVNPLSSFYSVLLPQGLSHSLNQTSYLTLTYDTDADPSQINVYFFNGTEYLIEQNLRSVDTVNHTITVGVNHFSTFVVLQNSQPVIVVGAASSGAAIDVFNFPNPFDLQTKTKTLNRGGATATLTTDGTIIRYFIPAAMVGATHIDIYDVVGEKVRSMDLGIPAGDTFNYVTWDGKNDSGKKVASGVYIGELKSGGSKAFWKMAVIK